MKFSLSHLITFTLALIFLALPACHKHDAHTHIEHNKIVVTSPDLKDVILTQQYVCQIHSQRHINVCALEDGYLEEIPVKEGQAVKKGELLFKVLPTLYQAKLDAEMAEAQLAQLEYNNTNRLFNDKVVSLNEVALYQAKLAKAQAKAKLAQAELNFTNITAPFDGIIDRLCQQQGSLVAEREVLTTLSDNSLMWVYFNVPEARYLEYMDNLDPEKLKGRRIELPDTQIELVLANGRKFKHSAGNSVTVEGMFNNETGNIPFRADFPNPEGLLRHGQTGTVNLLQKMKNSLIIPQRATFEILDKEYVWVVGEDHIVHQRPIVIANQLEDIYIIKSGLQLKDRIILEGVQQVHEGQKLEEVEFMKPSEVLAHFKHHAE